jgi:cytochrome c2
MFCLLLVTVLMAACQGGKIEGESAIVMGGNPQRGEALIRQYGCGACHTIPGVRGADGVLASPLMFFARRSFIGGQVPNTPTNLVQWILKPEAIEPGTAMPTLGLDLQQARDVAAYLYTLQ